MTDATGHLPYWTLEQLAEDEIPHRERTLAEQHLRACEQCATELRSARTLIAALQRLPTYEPSPGFAESVMARVVIAPAAAPALAAEPARVRRWLPGTRRGWSLLGALVLLPALPLLVFGWWLFSHPGVSAGSLWSMAGERVQEMAWGAAVDAAGALLRSAAADWAAGLMELASAVSVAGMPVAVMAVAVAIPASAWMMVRLLKTPMGGMTHAH